VTPKGKSGDYICRLLDFSTPNSDLVPAEVRDKITKWSDYVDYWAVDWNFQNDTFNHGFVTYRTRHNRALQLESDPHTFEMPGIYQVLVKVIDIFGNDTSTMVEVKVKETCRSLWNPIHCSATTSLSWTMSIPHGSHCATSVEGRGQAFWKWWRGVALARCCVSRS
jgi:hypothetical protein